MVRWFPAVHLPPNLQPLCVWFDILAWVGWLSVVVEMVSWARTGAFGMLWLPMGFEGLVRVSSICPWLTDWRAGSICWKHIQWFGLLWIAIGPLWWWGFVWRPWLSVCWLIRGGIFSNFLGFRFEIYSCLFTCCYACIRFCDLSFLSVSSVWVHVFHESLLSRNQMDWNEHPCVLLKRSMP